MKWVYQMTPYDEWDFDGINEMILADINVKGKPTKALVHFDRNGFGYTLDRTNGALLVAEKYDPAVNWATNVDMKTGRPQVVAEVLHGARADRMSTPRASVPAALGSARTSNPRHSIPENRLFYVPTNHVCMDYEPFKVEYVAGPAVRRGDAVDVSGTRAANMGNFITWDAGSGKIVQSKDEKFSVWSGALTTAGGLACYGTLEGYLKCVDAKDINKELFKFKTPSGIIGNVFTYEHKGKQYIGCVLGHRRLGRHRHGCGPREGPGWPGRRGRLQANCVKYTELGGSLTVFALPQLSPGSCNNNRIGAWLRADPAQVCPSALEARGMASHTRLSHLFHIAKLCDSGEAVGNWNLQ